MLGVMDFGGCTHAYYYLKSLNAFFRGHVEPAFFDSYNYCWQGSCVWWFIRPEHIADRPAALRGGQGQAPVRAGGAVGDGGEAVRDARVHQAAHVLSAGAGGGRGAGQRIVQEEGMAIITRGYAWHQGMVGSEHSVQEAVNFVTPDWLTDGLVRLVEYLDHLQDWVQASQSADVNSRLWKLLFDSGATFYLNHLLAHDFMPTFLGRIKDDLDAEQPQDYPAHLQPALKVGGPVRKNIDRALELLAEHTASRTATRASSTKCEEDRKREGGRG